jgi:hypothetical protein
MSLDAKQGGVAVVGSTARPSHGREDEARRRYEVSANVGDRIVVESEQVGTPAREGEILEVIPGSASARYRVRWDDGHESLYSPAAGGARFLPKKERRSA